MPSKRGWRAMGAALMETGRQVHLDRAEKLEQQKADNLHSIAQQRTDLMGQQVDIQKQSATDQAEYNRRNLEIQGENQEAQNRFRIDSMNNDASLRELLIEGQQATSEQQAVYQNAMIKLDEKRVSVLEATNSLTNLRTFMDTDVPNTVNSYLDIKDLEKAKLRETALNSVIEAGMMNVPPKQFEEYMQNIEANLGSDVDVRELDKKAFKDMFNELRTKKNLLAPEISDTDLMSLVSGRKRAEGAATEALSSTNTLNPAFANTEPYSHVTSPLPHYKRSTVPPLVEDSNALVNSIAQVLAEPDKLEGGELMNLLPTSIGNRIKAFGHDMTGGGEAELAAFNKALPQLEAHWRTFQRRYPQLENKTFEEALPEVYRMFNLTPPPARANPQASLMGGPMAPTGPETPGAGLMNGLPNNDYSGAV